MTMAPEEREALGTQPLPAATWEYGDEAAELNGGAPDGTEPPAAGGLLKRRWKSALVILIIVVLLAAGGTTYLLTRSSGPTYRTVPVTTGDVRETTATTGTVEPGHSGQRQLRRGRDGDLHKSRPSGRS